MLGMARAVLEPCLVTCKSHLCLDYSSSRVNSLRTAPRTLAISYFQLQYQVTFQRAIREPGVCLLCRLGLGLG